ncbi:MAG: Crp/Fnr family transcriptional regulator [Desulfobacteraceae bacterium]|nr:Crp/Fnr family transcriptional regulator [Desulfobacteraceae bacterium]
MEKEQIIKDSIFFCNLSEDEIATIAASSTIKEFAHDEVILEEQKPAENLYLLLEGSVALSSPTQPVEFEINKPGEIFGLSSLFEDFPRYSSSVICKHHAKVLETDSEVIKSLLKKNPAFGYHFMNRFASNIWKRHHSLRTNIFEKQYKAQVKDRSKKPSGSNE